MKHSFVNVFACLMFLMFSCARTAEGETTSSPCSPIQSIDVRGPPGISGKPGQKGEIGENSTAEIINLENTATDIQRNIAKILAVIRRGFLRLDDGWISPLNGFQYKIVAANGGWQNGRGACQTVGGDLATHGIQNWETRRIIFDALAAPPGNGYWVGLEDEGHEGSWQWINGRSSSTRQTALWSNGEPNSSASYNCALIHSSFLFMYTYLCSFGGYYALCQKPI